MRKVISYSILTLTIFSCSSIRIINLYGKETVSPKYYKIEIPFILKNGAMYVKAKWGVADTSTHLFRLDNHAPTSVLTPALINNQSLSKIGNFFIDAKTSDGSRLKNTFYKADIFCIGSIKFNNVLLNELPLYYANDTSYLPHDGLLGLNIISKAVWKFDFENNIITISNNIDSLGSLQSANKLTCDFTEINIIKLKILMPNNITEIVETDLGYTSTLILSKSEFDKINIHHNETKINGGFVTAAGYKATNNYILEDQSVSINNSKYYLTIFSIDDIRNNLLGMGFFSSFKYVIFDYVGKEVYLSNKILSSNSEK